jgi:hypothetical protein
MKAKPRKQSLARDHKDSANERKEARTMPAEQRNQELGTYRRVSRPATQGEKLSARSSRRRDSSSNSEFELPI